MAVIATNSIPSHVDGEGEALSATGNLSGSIMEMLATVYSYILMSAIREAIQNGCDAARRAGLSFSEGVLVELPTVENPVITVTDKGSGMTKDFMEASDGYLCFGATTKGADDNSTGGLGVGRWAAYGYIRECHIQTTHASDMIERHYFQFQGDNDMPQVKRAVSRAGSQTGTIISFPVNVEEVDEAIRAVAWLKDIMQMTMGDSFSVDAPAALATATNSVNKKLPQSCGVVLELESFDPALKGVRVYPMQSNNLHYSSKELVSGSLVVLTNQEAGVGGLPFHVHTSGESAFSAGMIIEIPMSFRVPFMPSREALKYNAKVNALMESIDSAVRKAAIAKVQELYDDKSLSAKKLLTDFLANGSQHFVAKAMSEGKSELGCGLQAVGGRSAWTGKMHLSGFNREIPTVQRVRYREALSKAEISGGRAYVPQPGGKPSEAVLFYVSQPPILVANDLASGGMARFRAWAQTVKEMLVLVSGDSPADAVEQVRTVSAYYGHELKTLKTSDLPALAKRVIKGGTVHKATKTSLLYHAIPEKVYGGKGKQETAEMSFIGAEPGVAASRPRVWLAKDGSVLGGLTEGSSLGAMVEKGFELVVKRLKTDRVYFLNKKSVAALESLINSVKEAGAWDLDEDEFNEVGLELTYGELQTLKLWVPLETAVAQLVEAHDIKGLLDGSALHSVVQFSPFDILISNLARRPRMELVGTRLDAALAPYFDSLTGLCKVPAARTDNDLRRTVVSMADFGLAMELSSSDPAERHALKDTLLRLSTAGRLEVKDVYAELCKKFPILDPLSKAKYDDATLDQYMQAMALMFR